MLLRKLINNLSKDKRNIKIKGLAVNSKEVKKGFIFFAIAGNRINGEKYINEAIDNGAVVIVCSRNCRLKNKKIQFIKTSNVRHLCSEISSKFFKKKPKNIIAVTGTNGKTSVADLFYQILNLNKIPVASIGTLGIKYKSKIFNSELTSPETIFLHKTLEKIKKNKIENVIIEASSHGIDQKRMDHLNLEAGIFTNFSQDHLDYHRTMKAYLNAKLLLFSKLLPKKKTIITDKNIKEFPILKKISKQRKLRLIDISKISDELKKIKNINFNEFQLKNLSMAVVAAKLCKLKESKIFKSIKRIQDVSGRLELVRVFPNNIKVFVDFAHTPDALEKSLMLLKKSYKKNISLVFGCGGDRDLRKRPLMAKVANSICKKIYVTDDNPRNEKPEKIRREIVKYLKKKNFHNIGNRAIAIKTSIIKAEPGEIILVAGKGHESKQIYENKIINISDKKIIKNLKLRIKKISNKEQNYLQNIKIAKKIIKKNQIKKFHGLSVDTRSLKKNNLCLTIKGKNNDGSKFISKALKKGAKQVISSKNIKTFKGKVIKVENEIKFLNQFAIEKRNTTNAKIFAITGSAGKTSLKNLLSDLLKNFGPTLCSPKSYNNYLGVPLSISHLADHHKFGIFEVGMSKAGEIDFLTKIIRPHIGIITNVGAAHIENFQNLKGIANAKSEIMNNIEKGGVIILNRDDKYFNYFKKISIKKELKIITFGMNRKSDIYPLAITARHNFKNLTIKAKDQIVKFKLKNINVQNVLASIAILKELNLDLNRISKIFEKHEATEGRGKIHKIQRYKKNFNLIDESYNANPLSVKNAIKNFNSIKKVNFKKYLVLGDMLELGKKSESLHKDLSKVINNSDIDKVFIKGSNTLTTFQNIRKNKRGNIFQQDEDVDFTLNNIIANNDYLMIKGSNATGLNNISKKIIKGH